MKTRIVRSFDISGNALLVTAIFMAVVMLTIGGYMTYVMQQARLGGRSQAWNMALAVSEAGIEEGLQHLNADAIADSNNLSADSWVSVGPLQYSSPTRNLGGSSFLSSYVVTINFQNSNEPVITAIAHVTPPAVAKKSSPFFYATVTPNNNTTSTTGNPKLGRGVQITCIKPPFFNAALVAKGNIDMHGNNVTVDSFDSGVTGDNVNGQWLGSVSGDQGIVASMGGITNSISIGNANIYGNLYSGVNEATNVGSQGFVGTHAYAASGGTGFEPGHTFNDANFTFPDTSFPYGAGGGITPTSNTVPVAIGTNFTAFTNYNVSSIPGAGSLTNGQTLGPITTNATTVTMSTYPGAIGGLVTNFTSATSPTYPGALPGLSTNCTGFTVTTSNPGQEPCMSTNTVTTNVTSTAQIPSPPPSGLGTNTTAQNNTTTPPVPGDYVGNVNTNSTVSTNATSVTSSSAPSPGSYMGNVATNSTSTTSATYPSPGSYVGNVQTNYNGNSGNVKNYTYNQINGYTYDHINSYNTNTTYTYQEISSYSYPITYYTYANQLSYTYQIISYTYETNNYTYTVFSQTPTFTNVAYDDVLSGGNYYSSGALGNTIITGNSTLVMPNGFNVGSITIAPGGSLTLYVGGTSFSFSGNQFINQNGLAQNLIVYCAPTVTSISFNGNAGFEGVIVAPNANVSMNGSGNSPQDFSGAIMANSVTMNGHFNFHYDVALSRVPSPGRFVANSWQEIAVSN